jgi:hypothetical protein
LEPSLNAVVGTGQFCTQGSLWSYIVSSGSSAWLRCLTWHHTSSLHAD